jgi:hypothetical protein
MGSGYRVFTAGEVLSASNVQNYLQDQAVMVFGGTAARSSAIGTANFEEGMLTYLTDVDKLQVYTGAAFADVYPAAASTQGLTLINTTSFSAVASQSFNDVFSATYENYRIVGTLAGSGTLNLLFRFRVAGSDNSTSNYTYSFGRARSTDFQTTFSGASQTSAQIGVVAQTTNAKMPFSFDIYQPFASFYSCGLGFQQDNSNAAQNMGGWYFVGNTSFTGFSLITSTGTMSGEVSIYGYNK